MDLYICGKRESLEFCAPQVRKNLVHIPILSEKRYDLARRRRENFEVFDYFVWISKAFLNCFVRTLKMKHAPLISPDFEEMNCAPLEIQISGKLNETRPPKFGPGGSVKGGGF